MSLPVNTIYEYEFDVKEIFTSFQGEGLLLGYPQLFIRLSQCNLSCTYCDTVYARFPAKRFRQETKPFSRKFSVFENPVEPEQLVKLSLQILEEENLHSLAITGGEPLLQTKPLSTFLNLLKKEKDIPILLETNGTLTKELNSLGASLSSCDYISMDVKLPSVGQTRATLSIHEEFLAQALNTKATVFLKVVVSPDMLLGELEEYLAALSKISKAPALPLFIQPVFPFDETAPDMIIPAFRIASKYFKNTRVIGQSHKNTAML